MSERSAAQIDASRANGAQSNGPVSENGRASSALNSRKHGLCAKEFRLEDPAEKAHFDLLFDELVFVEQAVTQLQKEACHHLAVARWRRRVCDNLEAELLRAVEQGRVDAATGGDGLPGLNALNRYRARIAKDVREAEAEIESIRAKRVKAFQAQIDKAREFSQLSMLNTLKNDLGQTGLSILQSALPNEPKPMPVSSQPESVASSTPISVNAELNRKMRRRAEKLAQKRK